MTVGTWPGRRRPLSAGPLPPESGPHGSTRREIIGRRVEPPQLSSSTQDQGFRRERNHNWDEASVRAAQWNRRHARQHSGAGPSGGRQVQGRHARHGSRQLGDRIEDAFLHSSASKSDLFNAALASDAGPGVFAALNRLPERQFISVLDVWSHLADLPFDH